jgi:hypothetical protein
VRPYPAKTAGIPLEFEYEVTTGSFTFKWCNPDPKSSQGAPTVDKPPLTHPEINALETEIFLPSMIAHGRNVVVSGLEEGDLHVYDETRQTLFVIAKNTQPGKVHDIQVKMVAPEGYKPRPPPFQVNDFWGDYGFVLVAVFVLMCALVLGISGVMEKFV